jgi:hypothetical protein
MPYIPSIGKVVFEKIIEIAFHRIRASAKMDNRIDCSIDVLVQPRPQTGFVHILPERFTDQVFPFSSAGDIVHEQNVVTINAVQCRQGVAADKPRSSREYDHVLFLNSCLVKHRLSGSGFTVLG